MDREKKQYCIAVASVGCLLVLLCVCLWGPSARAREGSQIQGSFPVQITEILTSNTSYPDENGLCCDYIELYNAGKDGVDLYRYQLTDGSGARRFLFPQGSVLAPGEYLVIGCDSEVKLPGYGAFSLSRGGGESVTFLSPKGVTLQRVQTIAAGENQSQIPIGHGTWELTDTPTPGYCSPEEADAWASGHNPKVSTLQLREVMTNNRSYSDESGLCCDWVELYNDGTNSLDISGYVLTDDMGVNRYTFPAHTVVGGGEYLVVYCASDKEGYAPIRLSSQGGEMLILKNGDGAVADMVKLPSLGKDEALALGDDGRWSIQSTATPGFPNDRAGYEAYKESLAAGLDSIRIWEFMPANTATVQDPRGGFSDWIELYNRGTEAVDLKGWMLSDDPTEPDKWVFPSLVMEPGEYLLLFCGAMGEDFGPGFSLSAQGESLVLTNLRGVTVHSLTFGPCANDQAMTYEPDMDTLGASNFATPGFSNDLEGYEAFQGSLSTPQGLAIWEVMNCNTTVLPQDFGKYYDFVELKNTSDQPIKLSDYALTDDMDYPNLYVLPELTLAPEESLVIFLSGDTGLKDRTYYHGSFTLNEIAGGLFLVCLDGKLQDFVSLHDIPPGQSYGRAQQGSGWYYMEPTPVQENTSGVRTPAGKEG